jgi:hypothetical protein
MSNGYFLGKLINRLEGKEDLIKGLEQDPKNISRLRNNWTKVLEFLKKKSKFVSNLLFEIEEFLKENSIASLSLAIDIHNHYNSMNTIKPQKIVPRSIDKPILNKQKNETIRSKSTMEITRNKHENSQTKRNLFASPRELITEKTEILSIDRYHDKPVDMSNKLNKHPIISNNLKVNKA